MSLLTPESRDLFAASYPEVPHKLLHSLHQHPLLEFERLAQLAEALPEDSVEYNLANLPIAVNGKPDRGELSIGDMIRQVGTAGSWAVLQNIEQDPEYAALLNALLDKIVPEVESKTGKMMHRVGFIFVTSPGGVTPCHFDPEHNILLQIRGSKVMTQFPASDTTYASDQNHEDYHTGGPREVPWNERLETDGTRFALTPGEGMNRAMKWRAASAQHWKVQMTLGLPKAPRPGIPGATAGGLQPRHRHRRQQAKVSLAVCLHTFPELAEQDHRPYVSDDGATKRLLRA